MQTLILLTGGKGRRMGGIDKAGLLWDGRSFLARILERLGDSFDEILLAGATLLPPGLLRTRAVPDRHPGGGPLQGIAAGLAAMSGERAFLCGCDMPLVDPLVVRRLLEAQGPHAAVVPRVGGRPQFLHAVYGRACLPAARELTHKPGVPVARLLDRVDCLWLDESDLEDLPDWRDSFVNANTPEDVRLLKARPNSSPGG